ncbi:MAG: sigma-54-dependent Fis family transcriptional regulator [bacterium]|nr:sigma-54-dependent Fis family transcriptional regulator [bacterium]
MPTRPEEPRLDLLDRGQLADLLRAGRLLASTLDCDAVLGRLLELTNRLLRTEASSIILLDERRERLRFRASVGERAREVMDCTLSPGEGIAGWVIARGEPCTVEDVAADPRWAGDIAARLDFPTRSILCVPVICGGVTIGAVEAINTTDGRPFGEADGAMLGALADLAAAAIRNARRHGELERDAAALIEEIRLGDDIVGPSPQIAALIEVIRKVAPTDATVLLRGESGTGKELIARALHYNSRRRAKPFTCVNCTLFSETLIESELFGHERGAFTGASRRRAGRFEGSDGGTVFLDEVGSVSPGAQLKLLRVLDQREFERLGGSETIRADVRVIAATNEDLEAAIGEGRFREDLYYRLKVIEIVAPPLRERPEDIPALALHFLRREAAHAGRRVTAVSPEAMRLLEAWAWPGNVRELRNTIERAIVLGSGEAILPEHLPPEMRGAAPGAGGLTLGDAERERILLVLERAGWNKSRAARTLGVSRNRLERKIRSYGISPPPRTPPPVPRPPASRPPPSPSR